MRRWATKDVEVLDKYFSDGTLDSGAVLPLASAELTFDIEFGAFVDITFGGFGGFVPHDDVVPFGAFGHLLTVSESACRLVSSERESGNGSLLDISQLGFAANVAD